MKIGPEHWSQHYYYLSSGYRYSRDSNGENLCSHTRKVLEGFLIYATEDIRLPLLWLLCLSGALISGTLSYATKILLFDRIDIDFDSIFPDIRLVFAAILFMAWVMFSLYFIAFGLIVTCLRLVQLTRKRWIFPSLAFLGMLSRLRLREKLYTEVRILEIFCLIGGVLVTSIISYLWWEDARFVSTLFLVVIYALAIISLVPLLFISLRWIKNRNNGRLSQGIAYVYQFLCPPIELPKVMLSETRRTYQYMDG